MSGARVSIASPGHIGMYGSLAYSTVVLRASSELECIQTCEELRGSTLAQTSLK